MHLVGVITEIYYDARSYKYQIYSDVWILVDGALVSATPHCSSGTVYQSGLLWLHSVVSNSSFRYLMLPAAILCCSGYRNDVKKDR